jgi:hypothetical protein
MATIKDRIAVLEAKCQYRAPQLSPERKANIHAAITWWQANNRRRNLLPRDDMTEGEREALSDLMELLAEFEKRYGEICT